MNKKQLKKWYDDNLTEFDSEQSDIIENLIDNYNPVVGSEDHNESAEDVLEYMRKETSEKYEKHQQLITELNDDFKDLCTGFKYKCDMLNYQISKHDVDMQNKISEILDEQDKIIKHYPKKPKKPKNKKSTDGEQTFLPPNVQVIQIPENILPKELIEKMTKGLNIADRTIIATEAEAENPCAEIILKKPKRNLLKGSILRKKTKKNSTRKTSISDTQLKLPAEIKK